jgi:hypothetical protein
MNRIKLFSAIALVIVCSNACKETEVMQPKEEVLSFLADIRPTFFEKTNFDSKKVVAETSVFLEDFTKTYKRLEEQYNAGEFKSHVELKDMQLAGMYYSFYLVALCGHYLEGDITFKDINGSNKIGLFSNSNAESINFEEKELNAMMEYARVVAKQATYTGGFNDRVYGTFLAVRQLQERLKNKNHFNNPIVQDSVLNYMSSSLVNYNDLEIWNILMSMVTTTNYKDSLNTFNNPQMNLALFNINTRLVPGSLRDLGGRVPEILGPLYRFDINLKKLDWTLKKHQKMTSEDLASIKTYLGTLDVASDFIGTNKKKISDAWVYKETFTQRKQKVLEIKEYINAISTGKNDIPKPDLAPFIDSKGFKKAYTCYGCHQVTGL